MPTLAPRVAPVFGAATAGERTFLKRPRGVVAVAPPSCVEMGHDKFARCVIARKPSAPPAQKRARNGFDVRISERAGVGQVTFFVPAPALRHLKQRMDIHVHAVRAAVDGARILAAKRRPEAPSAEEAVKRRKTSSSMKPAPLAAHRRSESRKQPLPDRQRATLATTAQRPISKLIEKGKEALKRRRLEEIARAREKFRQELLEVEKAAMPDETIYPEDLEVLGLTELQYAVTRTRKQALGGAG